MGQFNQCDWWDTTPRKSIKIRSEFVSSVRKRDTVLAITDFNSFHVVEAFHS